MAALLPFCETHQARCCPLCRPDDRLDLRAGDLLHDPATGLTFHVHAVRSDGVDGAAVEGDQCVFRYLNRDPSSFAAMTPLGQGACCDCGRSGDPR